MKICVCSDSHGNQDGLQEIIQREKPETILFLGDGQRDWEHVDLPLGTVFAAVCGNCDWMSQEPAFRVMEFFEKRFFLTHGHLYHAKQGLWGLLDQARRHKAHLVLYGHTHRQRLDQEAGCLFLCPGSMSVGSQQYAMVIIEGEREPEIIMRQL